MKVNFKIGDHVVVARNFERVPSASYIGRHGTIIAFKCRDAIVQFDDDLSTAAIIIRDLDLENDRNLNEAVKIFEGFSSWDMMESFMEADVEVPKGERFYDPTYEEVWG